MVQSLAKGDKVIMNGGLIGTITKVLSDTELQIELEEGAKARVIRSMVASIIKGTAETKPAGQNSPLKKEVVAKAAVKRQGTPSKSSARGKPSKK